MLNTYCKMRMTVRLEHFVIVVHRIYRCSINGKFETITAGLSFPNEQSWYINELSLTSHFCQTLGTVTFIDDLLQSEILNESDLSDLESMSLSCTYM